MTLTTCLLLQSFPPVAGPSAGMGYGPDNQIILPNLVNNPERKPFRKCASEPGVEAGVEKRLLAQARDRAFDRCNKSQPKLFAHARVMADGLMVFRLSRRMKSVTDQSGARLSRQFPSPLRDQFARHKLGPAFSEFFSAAVDLLEPFGRQWLSLPFAEAFQELVGEAHSLCCRQRERASFNLIHH